MLRRTAFVLLGLLATAAAGIFAADHFGVPLPWTLASSSAPEQAPELLSGHSSNAEDASAAASDTAERALDETVAALVGDRPESPQPEPGSVALDISRISPDGASVFAGRAEPGAYITIFADGKAAGTVQADEGGSWSLSTEYKFASKDPNITFEAATAPPPEAEAEPEPESEQTAEPERTPDPTSTDPAATETEVAEDAAAEQPADDASAPAVAGDVMRKFEDLVSEAREDAAREKASEEQAEREHRAARRAQEQTQAALKAQHDAEAAEVAVKTAEPTEDVAERETAVATAPEASAPGAPSGREDAADGASPETAQAPETSEAGAEARRDASAGAATSGEDGESALGGTATAMMAAPGKAAKPELPAPIPVPIMFVYNEATLTPEGERAAELLLEYLQLKRLDAIELTGHADERGTHNYNFELSRERLETVAQLLKEGGYEGELKLTPKGKTEPFQGIDRSKYRGEALYQFDRRVELRVTR